MNLETGIVALIVLVFALRAVKQLFPASARRIASRLRSAFGFAPGVTAVDETRCGSGCRTCGACDTPASRQQVQPLHFEPPKR